jgi:hypothetical protein
MSEQPKQQSDLDAAMSKFEGNYIESSDLMHGHATLTIAGVVPPNTDKDKDGKGKLIDKPILSFERTTKRLIIGRTNERILKAIHGRKASGWIGKQITLGVRYLAEAFGEKNVPTIRIIPPADVPLPMSARNHFGTAEPKPRQ